MATIVAGDTVTLIGCHCMMTVECILEVKEEEGNCCGDKGKEQECPRTVRCVWCHSGRTKRETFAMASLQKWQVVP